MIPTDSLPAQQITSSRPVRAGSGADRTTDSAPLPETPGFEALISRLSAEASASGQPAMETGQVEGQEPVRQGPRRSRDKPLQAEDVLPMELLLTLYAQQQMPPMPQTLATPAPNDGLAGQDAPTLPEIPPQPGSQTIQAVATLQAMAELPNGVPMGLEGGGANSESGGAKRTEQAAGSAVTVQTVPLQSRDQIPRLPMPVDASLPADFAEHLVAATKPVSDAHGAPRTPKRAPTPRVDNATSFAAAATNAAQQPAAQRTPTVTTLQRAAPVSTSPTALPPEALSVAPPVAELAPQIAPKPLEPIAQAAPKPVNPTAQPRQPLSARAADRSVEEIPGAQPTIAGVITEQPADRVNKENAAPPERLRETPLVVTRQDTVLPANGQQPIAHQAAERIIAELQSSDGAVESERAQPTRPVDSGTPVRVLHIQLQPADLGTLTVKLSLRDQMLDVKLEAAEHRTARLLEADREKLTEILRSAGYSLDGVTVQISSPEKPVQPFYTMPGQGDASHAQHGAQSQPGGAQPDAQRGQGSRQGNDDRSFASRNDGGDHASRPGSVDGDVYL